MQPKRDGVIIYAILNLKNVMLSERHMTLFHLYGISWTDEFIETEQISSQENGKELLSKYGILFRSDENLLKLDRNDGCNTTWALNTTQLFTSFLKDLFIWLQQALVVACRSSIFSAACELFRRNMWTLSCCMWDIFP